MNGTATKKAILIVIDGLTPSVFEAAVDDGRAPALSFLAEHGEYARAVSTFPSLTPVCLSSLATGASSPVGAMLSAGSTVCPACWSTTNS